MVHIFEVGMRVHAESGRHPPGLEGKEWVVSEVKYFSDCCDCGKGARLSDHWGSCISYMWSLEAGHHQRLTIRDKDGTEHYYSGAWFVPA